MNSVYRLQITNFLDTKSDITHLLYCKSIYNDMKSLTHVRINVCINNDIGMSVKIDCWEKIAVD